MEEASRKKPRDNAMALQSCHKVSQGARALGWGVGVGGMRIEGKRQEKKKERRVSELCFREQQNPSAQFVKLECR